MVDRLSSSTRPAKTGWQFIVRLGAVPVFSATLFLSAGLLFLVEPMVAKMVLPRLGGSPAVWTTCLVFFQATLLLGYAYAYCLARWTAIGTQFLIHVGLVLPLAALSLPLHLGQDLPVQTDWPAAMLLRQLIITAGVAVLAISATAPLLQSWFSKLDNEAARDPYFLYAGSNAGSLLALLAYPLLVEPALSLADQAKLWVWGFVGLSACIGLCGAATLLQRGGPRMAPAESSLMVAAPGWGERLRWIALAFVPSSLLLGVTSHITTEVASAPLLWVVPLALYLLTFIFAFARRPVIPHTLMIRAMPFLIIPTTILLAPGLQAPLPFLLILHLGSLFVAAMVCHGELARLRPPAQLLTEFYLFMSLGGVLGGMFNALLAPVIFPGVWEYPIALVAACLIRPGAFSTTRSGLMWDILLPLGLFAAVLLALRFLPGATEGGHLPPVTAIVAFLLPGLALMNFSARRLRFACGVAACITASAVAGSSSTLEMRRSFFGVYRVQTVTDGATKYVVMMHGTTQHGVQSLAPGEATAPMGYYGRAGLFGQVFAALPGGAMHRIGVIGLGAGELACYATQDESWTFYEIDPLVLQIASDTKYFHFLSGCDGKPRVVLGDARLTLAGAPDHSYDLLILDAFSSDTIPMHLITREALALYLRKLAPGGRLVFHISCRRLDLHNVVGSLAADAGMTARIAFDTAPPHESLWRRAPAVVVAMAKDPARLANLDAAHGWRPLPSGGPAFLWTDQRSDLLSVMNIRL